MSGTDSSSTDGGIEGSGRNSDLLTAVQAEEVDVGEDSHWIDGVDELVQP